MLPLSVTALSVLMTQDDMLGRRGMTDKDPAERIGLSETQLSLFRSGKARGIRFATLSRLCIALHCQPGDLLGYPASEDYLAVEESNWTRKASNCRSGLPRAAHGKSGQRIPVIDEGCGQSVLGTSPCRRSAPVGRGTATPPAHRHERSASRRQCGQIGAGALSDFLRGHAWFVEPRAQAEPGRPGSMPCGN